MPAKARGSVYPIKGGYGIRWVEDGRRRHKSPFATKTAARDWFDREVAARLVRGGPSPQITFDEFCGLYLERWGPTVAPRTLSTMLERLAPSRERFGDWPLEDLEGAAADIAAWRAGLSASRRYRLTHAMRQTLMAAVRWGYIHRNPAVDAGPNARPRREELRPFTRAEIDMVAAELGAFHGGLVLFAVETGLRTNEWAAIERRDIDRSGPAVVVQRRYANGRLVPYPKTAGARRRVPLTPRALAAIESLPPRLDTPLQFPASRGGYIGLDNWRSREWYPALEAAGVEPRGPYHLRHTFATEALAAGVSVFQLARLMGTSVQMIDETYGHLAHDSEAHLRGLLTGRSGVEVALSGADIDEMEG